MFAKAHHPQGKNIFHFLASQEFLVEIPHWEVALRPDQVKIRILY